MPGPLLKRYRQFRKALKLLPIPSFRKAMFRGVGAAVEHQAALARVAPPRMILDVGANKGQFSLLSRHLFPKAEIIAFEPLPDTAVGCAGLFADDPTHTVIQGAVGAVPMEMTMHVSNHEDSSSLLPIAGEQVRLFPGTEEKQQIRVSVAPLSHWLRNRTIERPVLLKIDVQGFELAVLDGAADILDRIDTVYVEASFRTLYSGQALVTEVMSRLMQAGFHLLGIYNIYYDADGQSVQGDFLFSRAPPQ